MIITIGGQAGSGKSTVGRIVAEKLGYRYYSIGDMRREMASKRGMTLGEFNKMGEKEEFTDKEVDDFQRELGKKGDNLVINGRTSYYFIPDSFKVYLKADIEKRAERVLGDSGRKGEEYKNIEEVKEKLKERDGCDLKRYLKFYGIDPSDESSYDLVVDTSGITAEQVAGLILDFLRRGSLV